MLIDINTHLGPYPFRQIRHHTVDGVLGVMDRNQIDHAVVSSNTCLLYRDVHRGNEELLEAHSCPRMSAIATISPLYSSWKRDMAQAINDWHFKAVRLAPQYHDYDLCDNDGQAALAAIDELNVPLVLHERIEDHRQTHAWDKARPMPFDNIAQSLKNFPNLKVMLLNGLDFDAAAIQNAGLAGRVLIDLNRFDVTLFNQLENMIADLGVDSFAFGSHMPMNYVGPALVRMDVLRLSDEEKELIAWQNAAKFLDLNIDVVMNSD